MAADDVRGDTEACEDGADARRGLEAWEGEAGGVRVVQVAGEDGVDVRRGLEAWEGKAGDVGGGPEA